MFSQTIDTSDLPSVIIKEYVREVREADSFWIKKCTPNALELVDTGAVRTFGSRQNINFGSFGQNHEFYFHAGADRSKGDCIDSTANSLDQSKRWYFLAGTFQVQIVAEGAYLDGDRGLVIPPTPGYREIHYYWNGRWWSEYEYDLGMTNYNALCAIQYFEGEKSKSKHVWVTKFDQMSSARFNRLNALIDATSGIDTDFFQPGDDRIRIRFEDENGRIRSDIDFEFENVKGNVLSCIKNSRITSQRKK